MAARYSPSQPGILVTCGSDSARGVPFKVWEVGSQKPRRVAIKEPLTCCEVAEKAALAVAGGATGKVYVVQLTKQFDIRPFSGGPTAQAATSVAISNSGKRIAAGYYGGAVHVWEEKKKGDSKPVAELGFAVAGMAFLSDEQTLAVACDQAVRFYNTEDGSELDPIEVEGTVLSMALDSDTNTLAVGLNEGGVQLFDAATRDSKGMLAEGTSPRSLAFSPNGRQLAVGDMRGKINVWDVAESSRVIECDGKWQAIISLSFSTDGLTLAGVEERHRDVSFWMMPSARRPAGSKSKTPAKGHSSN
jgi:WD40 repeat protein